jgi:hypothetical protein
VTYAGATRLWTNRATVGAFPSRTRAHFRGIVTTEGGGFSPTLELGGGASR